MRGRVITAVGVGAAVGSVLRYAITPGVSGMADAGFPWANLWVNISGAGVLAIVATLVTERWPPTRYVRPFVGIGLCGGYTTWSTFMTETALLVRDGQTTLATVYVAERIDAFLPTLDELITEGLVVREPVEIVKYVGRTAP
jgi:fluoride exporter